ncbi:sensor histidine kinase [Algivirga pacifica]|uniref:histidine kinase n=1 Tax=Algivirga pacifica TaxID=1162670 RepID=A0ABP9DFD9_9BACT
MTSKNPKNAVSLTRTIFLSAFSIALGAILLIVGIWSLKEIQAYQKEAETLRYDKIDRQKLVIRNQVNNAFNTLERERLHSLATVKKELKQETLRISLIAQNLFEHYSQKFSRTQQTRMIYEAIAPLGNQEALLQYSILDYQQKKIILDTSNPKLNNASFSEKQQPKHHHLYETALKEGEGLYFYKAPPSTVQEAYGVYAYFKTYAPLNIILVVQANMSTIEKRTKQEVLNKMATISFGDDGYIFAQEDNRQLLLQGKVMLDTAAYYNHFVLYDEEGNTHFLSDINNNTPDRFYYYKFYRPGQEQLVNKISYIRYYPHWNWTIGAGLYTDVVEQELAENAQNVRQRIYTDLLYIIITAIGLSILLWWRLQKTSHKVSLGLTEFSSFFRQASNEHVKINPKKLHYQEFQLLANMANEMLEEREKTKTELQLAYNEIQTSEEELRQQSESLQMTNEHLEKVLKDLKQTQNQLVHSEKMASIGQLTAGIAHEINNPINFVSANVDPLQQDIEDLLSLIEKVMEELQHTPDTEQWQQIKQFAEEIELETIQPEIVALLDGIREGAQRTKTIVMGLSAFARVDQGVYTPSNIEEGIESTLLILNNKIKKSNVCIQKDFSNIPPVECLPNKLNQVFMNILINAIQASSNNEGCVLITTRHLEQQQQVEIEIRDNGPGIPKDLQRKIFEPFFTTKEVGEGTGLGLSISYGIIEQHQGRIEVESQQGDDSYTAFRIILPLVQKTRS